MRRTILPLAALSICLTGLLAPTPARAGVHLWRVSELFSNADGSIQFIELAVCCNSTGETNVGNRPVFSNSSTINIPANVPGPTTNKRYLIATASFAALPGAPAPDLVMPEDFFSVSLDAVSFSTYDTFDFGGVNPALPLDGAAALHKDPDTQTVTSGPNSPTNYAGDSGSVVIPAGPPPVPTGSGGSTPLTVDILDAAGTELSIAWDTSTCSGAAGYSLLYGEGGGYPIAPGQPFTLLGAECAMGASPHTWSGVPTSTDGSKVIWFIVVADDGSGVEGSWGKARDGSERAGPGTSGSSGLCGSTDRSLANVCAQ